MPISKADYEDKKEYWDYQRLLEFNRELLKQRLAKMQGSTIKWWGQIKSFSSLIFLEDVQRI